MNLYQGLRIGLLEIRAHKLQSFLTFFGVVVGITSVVAMTGIMSKLERGMAAGIQRMGPGRLFVRPRSTMTNRSLSEGLVYEDAEAIRRHFPAIRTVSPSMVRLDNFSMGDFNAKGHVLGVTTDWTKVDWKYDLKGRFFNEEDLRTYAKVCVLIRKRRDPKEFWRQKDALDPLFLRRDPLGKDLRVGQTALRVIGILQEAPRDEFMDFNWGEKHVLVPITTFQKRLSNESKTLFMLDLDAGDPKVSGLLAKRVFALLKRRHRGVEDFKIQNIADKMGESMKNARIFSAVMGAIAAIALFAGGVGIMNITLASVNARIKEIGIRKSVGARERDIQAQFLLEAAALSLTGGIVGVAAGCGICLLVKLVAKMAVLPSVGSIATALLVSAGGGVISAWYPARQASRLDPVEALRHE